MQQSQPEAPTICRAKPALPEYKPSLPTDLGEPIICKAKPPLPVLEEEPVRLMTYKATVSPKSSNKSNSKKSVMPKNNSFYNAPVISINNQQHSNYSLVQKSSNKQVSKSPVKFASPVKHY